MDFLVQMVKAHRVKFTRFSVVGIANTAIDFVLFYILFEWAGWPMLVANAVSFTAAVANSFIFNSLWTFSHLDRERPARQFVRFFAVSVSALGISMLSLYLLAFLFPVLLAKVFSIGATILFNYAALSFFVYRK